MSHTYALLDVSWETYKEIRNKLEAAGYQHAFGTDGEIDMHGIALTMEHPDGGPVSTAPTLATARAPAESAREIEGGEGQR
jgi:hypothetical protein